ncbi:NAD(P)-dependent alcohol dehydrogenase [Microbacterium bovistercoris]|uniref:NAD(P)-dependent alcohol dehydrogenase n=1 Tax=Microbacterium bovistercoris TaxID=2293570 RepID=A0A371NZS8_9MICO|nr:NAD(P)-dependent alcohol dehydrogenase [Microbacterium bovistercoris]REJ08377.1 NAD(P)-dependent alcohol dehydrogenase [Microbacterium bovistercoris]
MPETMDAWVQNAYGPAAAIHRAERPTPVPSKGQVLLKVRAIALNAGDVRIMQGDPMLVRPVFGFARPRQPIRGMDVAGTVVALGPGADAVRVGDEVVVELPGGGGLAEYAVAPAARLVPRPSSVSPRDAACLPIAAGTARQALDAAGIAAGGRVLVIAASGGVGTFAVQLAASVGAEVHATCAARNAASIGRLGATTVLDRDQPLRELPAGSYDAVIDIAGTAPLRDLQRLIVDGGRVVLVSGQGGRVLGPVGRMLRAAVLSVGSRRRIRPLSAVAKPEMLRELLALVEAGTISPLIEAEYPFDEAGAALARVEAGHVVGKIVVHGV